MDGNIPVYLYLEGEKKKLQAQKDLWVDINEDLLRELTVLLGKESVKISS